MKILYKDDKPYTNESYRYFDLREAINKRHELVDSDPDLIIYGYGFDKWDEPQEKAPKVFLLDKPYRTVILASKWDFVERYDIRIVLSPVPYQSRRVFLFPFAVDHTTFIPKEEEKLYDLGFAGGLHHRFYPKTDNPRIQIYDYLLNRSDIKTEWKDFYLAKQKYIEFISQCRIFFNTISVYNLVNERFFQLFACKVPVIANIHPAYIGQFEERHYIPYTTTEDFGSQLDYYLKNYDEATEKAEDAYEYVLKYHTWEKRVDLLEELVHETYSII
jgi:glycosyltransferase involved in cell wall biosynthesis